MSSRHSTTDLRVAMRLACGAFLAMAMPGVGTAVPCLVSDVRALLDRRVEVGSSALRVPLPAWKGMDLHVQAVEDGIDIEMSLVSSGRDIASVDSPVSRRGVQQLVVTREVRDASLTLRSVDQAAHRGDVRILVTELPGGTTDCRQFAREFAHADLRYAAAQKAARGEPGTVPADSESRAVAAEQAYRQIARSDDVRNFDSIRGDAELAVAAINYYNLSRWEESASWARAAADSLLKANRPYLRARARAIQAAAWLERPDAQGAFARARQTFDELAKFHRSRGETYDEALQINSIGVAHFNEAQFELAIPKYTDAQAMFARLGERQRSALALQNLALCEWGLGRMRHALPLFDRALADMDPSYRPKLYLLTLNNAALAHQVAGNFDKSLDLLEQALSRAKELGDAYYSARSSFGAGVTYYGIGNRVLARQFLRDALAIWTPQLDERGRLSALRALAVIESEDGNLALADRYNSEALGLARSTLASERISLKTAEIALARGDLAAAEEIIQPLAGTRPKADRLTQAEAWVARSKLRVRKNSLAAAEEDLRRALVVFKELESLSEEFDARVELARLLRISGRRDAASREIAIALELSEELRTQTANPEYRASVAAAIRPALDLQLDLLHESYDRLMRSGIPDGARRVAVEALAISDAARGRAFEQYRRQKLDTRDLQLAELLEQRAELLRDLADRRFYLATRDDRAGSTDARAQALREDIRRIRVSLGVADRKIAERASQTDTAAPRSIEAVLRRFAGAKGTGAIEYWIGGKASYAWVINGSEVSWIRLTDGPALTNAARRLHASLIDFAKVSKRERLAAAEELEKLVIAPLEKSLEGTHHWLIAPDGPLHFVPFAALRNSQRDQQYLVQRVSIAMTPALRHARIGTRKDVRPGIGRLLLVSDPIYEASDPRLVAGAATVAHRKPSTLPRFRSGNEVAPLLRLAATAREADGIRMWFPESTVDSLAGTEANRDAFLGRDLSQYRYVHVATHGVMDAEIPAMSALIFGAYDSRGAVRDQRINAGDLLATNLDADLVVLSACNTSLGAGFPDEGPMGLRYAVLARGGRAVVSSLWPTVDETNADVMTDMYGRMMGKGQRVELALADAMRAMLGRKPTLDPAFWASYSVYLVDF